MKRLLILFFFTFIVFYGKSQSSLSLYPLYRSVPKSNQLNPALQPDDRFFISLPVLSGVRLNMLSDLALNDFIIRGADDSLHIDPDRILKKINKAERLIFDVNLNILQFGAKALKGYFIVSASINNHFETSISRDLLAMMIRGNNADDIIGNRIDLSKEEQNNILYSKLGISYSRQIIDEKLIVGARLNLLNGVLAFNYDRRNSGYIYTNPDNYYLTLNADRFQYNISGYDTYLNGSWMPADIFKFKNPGYGLDLGLLWKVNARWNLTASAVNIGRIYWKSDVRNYLIENKSYTFKGINLDNINNIQSITDSISSVFEPEEITERFVTRLSPRTYLHASYQFARKQHVSLITKNLYLKNSIINTTSLAYQIRVQKFLDLSVGYSLYNLRYSQLGAGFSIFIPGLTFYIASDNIPGFFNPEKLHSADLTFGFNISIFDK